jgi:hypothetical protein
MSDELTPSSHVVGIAFLREDSIVLALPAFSLLYLVPLSTLLSDGLGGQRPGSRRARSERVVDVRAVHHRLT